jgi:hypothetical protein
MKKRSAKFNLQDVQCWIIENAEKYSNGAN